MPLTDKGVSDIRLLCDFLKIKEKIISSNFKIVYPSMIHTSETATIMAGILGVPSELNDQMKGIYLGVLDNLTDEDAVKRYPKVVKKINAWRRGDASIQEVSIPNAESMSAFYTRIYNFIYEIITKNVDVILVGTRSTGIAISNILKTMSPKIDFSNYERLAFDPCSVSNFTIINNTVTFNHINETSFLFSNLNLKDD